MDFLSGPATLSLVNTTELQAAKRVVELCIERGTLTKDELISIKNEVCKVFGTNTFPDMELLNVARAMEEKGEIEDITTLERLFQKRRIRTLSGVAPISVLMPPMPCKSACVYCPSERADDLGESLFHKGDKRGKFGEIRVPKKYRKKGVLVMPKSYISSEPGATRALMSGFDPDVQIKRRLVALERNGHRPEKCELIIQGGTFSDLPKNFRTQFIKRCYKAFNYGEGRQSLERVERENESAKHRVVGLTLETRPECISPEELREFRRLGCTRVELGVQTLDDEIHRKTKRRQKREDVVRATKLLRDAGFKICYHIMPNLPYSSPEKDLETYREICENPDFKPDLVKIYPCTVVPFSALQQWHKDGRYEPYSLEVLANLLVEMKRITPPWIRILRIIRDIPSTAIIASGTQTNLRQILQDRMKKEGVTCQCIRCREIRDEVFDPETAIFMDRTYEAADGTEHFLSYETKEGKLLALLRLRIPYGNASHFRALQSAGIVRELHSFGAALSLQKKKETSAQHVGFGKKLLQKAEEIAQKEGKKKLAVISGVGVKEFYRKQGFVDEGSYVVKHLYKTSNAKKIV